MGKRKRKDGENGKTGLHMRVNVHVPVNARKRIDDEPEYGVRETPTRMEREALAPTPRPAQKKRDRMEWKERNTYTNPELRQPVTRTQSWALALAYLKGEK